MKQKMKLILLSFVAALVAQADAQTFCASDDQCEAGQTCDLVSRQCTGGDSGGGKPCGVGATSRCAINEECASGLCLNGACSGCAGERCADDSSCGTGIVCVESTCLAGGVAAGGACEQSAQCVSGVCDATLRVCNGKVPSSSDDNPSCETDGECQSNNCYNRACQGMPTGGACTERQNCESGACDRNTCAAAAAGSLEDGDSCSAGSECSSGNCDGTRCVAAGGAVPTPKPTPFPTAEVVPTQAPPTPTPPTPQAVVPTPQAVVPTPQAVVPTPQAVVPTPAAVQPTPKPTSPPTPYPLGCGAYVYYAEVASMGNPWTGVAATTLECADYTSFGQCALECFVEDNILFLELGYDSAQNAASLKAQIEAVNTSSAAYVVEGSTPPPSMPSGGGDSGSDGGSSIPGWGNGGGVVVPTPEPVSPTPKPTMPPSSNPEQSEIADALAAIGWGR